MRFDAVIVLVAPGAVESDSIGRQVAADPVRRTVYANEFTLSAQEVYEAGAQGLKPECFYQVRSSEYEGESLMEIGDAEYSIIRVSKRGEWTQLIGERVTGNG